MWDQIPDGARIGLQYKSGAPIYAIYNKAKNSLTWELLGGETPCHPDYIEAHTGRVSNFKIIF
jgi:hypothetical protein